jgi:cytosine/adenosine deaminase-related metal-dependent hydrolase
MSSRFAHLPRSTRVRPDDIPASPPSEVLDAIARAHKAYERLEESGRHVHLHLDEETRRLALELTDAAGTPLCRLSAREVLDLAAGAPLP